MLALHRTAVFVAAALLFLLQPMFARMVLPLLGGAPAVWNTALVFYQAVLLAGYAGAHAAARWLAPRGHAGLQVALLLAGLASLPVALPGGAVPPVQDGPVPWLLGVLAVSVGLPFLALSATSPSLQAWLAAADGDAVRDPYVLYAASNLGSLLALLAYPALVEPMLPLREQSRAWALGYLVLLGLVAACAVRLRRPPGAAGPPGRAHPAPAPLTAGRRLRWVLLSMVPSSLMLSVTTYVSTDLAAVPLLWVVPLALYLLSLVLVFARRPPPHRLALHALPVVLLPLVMVLVARASEPLRVVLPTHLLAFLVIALVCHGELARDRPDPRHLTAFYLWLSLGGVLGGAFTALAAPLLFSSIVEYPLMIVLACLLPARPARAWEGRRARLLDVALPIGLGVLATGSIVALGRSGPAGDRAGVGLVFALLVPLAFACWRRPLRFALALTVLLVASTLPRGGEGRLLHAERSFFGVSRVTLDPSRRYRMLMHGTTLHGMQALDPARRREPLTYYAASGPVGRLFAAIGGTPATRAVAVVGLGTGSLACHGRSGERWTFYEIDPTVARIARDPRYFTFLRDCPPAVGLRLGDARLSLAAAPDGAYGVIVLDAYGSDAPPVHLLTLDALRLYLAKLAPGGLLVFNATNRHLQLEPVLADLARAAGLASLAGDDVTVTAAERAQGKVESRWVLMARRPEDLDAVRAAGRWRPARGSAATPWTDDFSSLLSALRWR